MPSFSKFGNDLYTGKRSIDFIGRRRTWYLISAVLLALAVAGLGVRHLNLSLEFTGGSEFRVSNVQVGSAYEATARDAVTSVEPTAEPKVSKLGSDMVRVQTKKLDDAQSEQVRTALADAFNTTPDQVSATFIGPSWGASVSQQALRALIVFLALVSLVMAVYFRTWKMAAAALVALAHDMVFTVGVYALTGFEVSPATMIGFLTVLGYSLYDTVVVFDKVRENTTQAFANRRMSYQDAANLAVNQTLVRSINTTVVALLPISAILFVGFTQLGPGTLLDLALALFVGMGVGAYSSIFIATPLLVSLRSKEPEVVKLAKQAAKHRAPTAGPTAQATPPVSGESGHGGPSDTEDATAGVDATEDRERVPAGADPEDGEHGTLTGRKVHKYAQTGPRNQPRRTPKSRR